MDEGSNICYIIVRIILDCVTYPCLFKVDNIILYMAEY